MPVHGMRVSPKLTRGWLIALHVSVLVFVVAAVVLAVMASRGSGSGAWAGAGAFAVAAVGQGVGLASVRRLGPPRPPPSTAELAGRGRR